MRSPGGIRTHTGIRMFLLRRYVFRCTAAPLTERERAMLYAPTSPRIGVEYGAHARTPA